MTIWCIVFSGWITKATNTQSEYVILIAFSQQQWLQERVSLLRNTCIFTSCLCFLQQTALCLPSISRAKRHNLFSDTEMDLSFVCI